MGSILSAICGGASSSPTTEATAEEASESRVNTFHSTNSWQQHFNSIKHSNQLLVVDFAASWCGPCRAIEPEVKAMANKYQNIEFVKIDVDELPDVARGFEVQAMPTFVLLKQGQIVEKIVGAKKDDLDKKIAQHAS